MTLLLEKPKVFVPIEINVCSSQLFILNFLSSLSATNTKLAKLSLHSNNGLKGTSDKWSFSGLADNTMERVASWSHHFSSSSSAPRNPRDLYWFWWMIWKTIRRKNIDFFMILGGNSGRKTWTWNNYRKIKIFSRIKIFFVSGLEGGMQPTGKDLYWFWWTMDRDRPVAQLLTILDPQQQDSHLPALPRDKTYKVYCGDFFQEGNS